MKLLNLFFFSTTTRYHIFTHETYNNNKQKILTEKIDMLVSLFVRVFECVLCITFEEHNNNDDDEDEQVKKNAFRISNQTETFERRRK